MKIFTPVHCHHFDFGTMPVALLSTNLISHSTSNIVLLKMAVSYVPAGRVAVNEFHRRLDDDVIYWKRMQVWNAVQDNYLGNSYKFIGSGLFLFFSVYLMCFLLRCWYILLLAILTLYVQSNVASKYSQLQTSFSVANAMPRSGSNVFNVSAAIRISRAIISDIGSFLP